MKSLFLILLIPLTSFVVIAQDARQQLLAAERGYARASEDIGIKQAAMQFFASDTVIFRPEAVNGLEFWKSTPDGLGIAIRSIESYDISSNGQIGFTSGSIETFKKGKSDPNSEYGNYATIWGRREGGTFRPIMEITTQYDRSVELKISKDRQRHYKTESNKSSRSAADPSMEFLKMSMGNARLGGAYKQYAAEDIRFLRDGVPPIIGKKRVAEFTKDYLSVRFPTKFTLIESGDMAYSWNPCNYANSDEGFENGNCLHVWKLRNKKWWIVLGVYARAINELLPELIPGPIRRKAN
jgi:hypothetical protein